MIFKQEKAPPVVAETLLKLGWTEFDPKVHSEQDWHLFWKTQRPTMGEFNSVAGHQKLIHFPKTSLLCTKDNLARTIKKNQSVFGQIYDFIPTTFQLPNEYNKFCDSFQKSAQNKEEQIWICKPTDLSRGRGITLINDVTQLKYD